MKLLLIDYEDHELIDELNERGYAVYKGVVMGFRVRRIEEWAGKET